MENAPDIIALRAQIDAVDDQIIALLKERMESVRQVGRLKARAAPGQCVIRPGREAEQLRRVTAAFERSDFLPAAGAAIWRMMIMAALALEGDLRFSVYAPDGKSELFWLAREYFGSFSAITRQPASKRVIGDLTSGKAQVGVLPLPEDSAEGGRWWPDLLGGTDQPRIFAYVPFLCPPRPTREVPHALAIGHIAPEPTGDDLSVWALQGDDSVSQHRLQTAFMAAGLEVRWVEVFTPTPGARWHLVEIKGFVTEDDGQFRTFADKVGSGLRATFLGAYATPIKMKA